MTHLARRRAHSNEFLLVEDKFLEIEVDALDGDAHRGDPAALAQRW